MITETNRPQLPPIEIPANQLTQDTLRGIIENFILREGTDYGREEVAFEKKIMQIQKQLKKGDVKIVFDPNIESVTLMTDSDWKKLSGLQKSAAKSNAVQALE